MRLAFSKAVLSAGIAAMVGGCDANQLYMGSKTVVGINAAVSPDQTKGWLVVGYDRTFAAVIPRSVDEKPLEGQPATGKQDAMTSLACSRLMVSGITIKYYTESIATGEAAKRFAQALSDTGIKPAKDFFNCFKRKPEAAKSGQAGGADQ